MSTYTVSPAITANNANQNAAEPVAPTSISQIIPAHNTSTYVAVPRTLTIGSGAGQAGYATGG